jgi:hypothetical protein
MNKTLLFDFTVDKPAKTVIITREFDAELSMVWMHLLKLSFLINGWLLPHGIPGQST